MDDHRKIEIYELYKVFAIQNKLGFKWIGRFGEYFLFMYGDYKLLIEENGLCILENNGKEIEIIDDRAKYIIDYHWKIKEWSASWQRKLIL